MGIRRKVSVFIGLTQSIIGGLAACFAYVLYHNLFDVQVVLDVPPEDVLLYMLVFIVFGLLSIISGLFLLNGEA